MFVTVIAPWEAEVFSGGPMRNVGRCCRHEIGQHKRTMVGTESLFRRRLPLSPWSEWKDLRRRQHQQYGSHCEVLHKTGYHTPAERRLDTMIEGFSKLLSRPVRDNAAANETLSEMIRWTVNNDRSSEAHGQLQLPFDLRSSDDLNVELDEATRTLTVRAIRTNDPYSMHHQLGGQLNSVSSSRWEYSQSLDDTIELGQLEAAVNRREGSLQFRAPLKTVCSSVCPSQRRDDTTAAVATVVSTRADTESPTRIDARHQQGDEPRGSGDIASNTTSIIVSRRPVEIEDLGPDEESDKISVSSIA